MDRHNKQKKVVKSSNSKGENVCSKTKFKAVKMPWIYLLDPITGELPKNYKEILAEEKRKREENSLIRPTVPLSEPVHMPYLGSSSQLKPPFNTTTNGSSVQLLQVPNRGVTGMTLANAKAKRSSMEFKVAKVCDIKPSTISNKANIPFDGIRKNLFNSLGTQARKSVSNSLERKSNKISKEKYLSVNSAAEDTLPLIEVSVAEEEMLGHQTCTVESTDLENIDMNKIQLSNGADNSAESNPSSLCEYLQLEQECRTPKQKVLEKGIRYISEELLNVNIQRCTNIIEHHEKCIEEMKEMRTAFEELRSSAGRKRKHSGTGNDIDNKENYLLNMQQGLKPPNSILTSKKKKALRIDTLKKNVTFDNVEDKVTKSLNLYNSVRRSCAALGTPKFNNLNSNSPQSSKKELTIRVQKQCLLLHETPS